LNTGWKEDPKRNWRLSRVIVPFISKGGKRTNKKKKEKRETGNGKGSGSPKESGREKMDCGQAKSQFGGLNCC